MSKVGDKAASVKRLDGTGIGRVYRLDPAYEKENS